MASRRDRPVDASIGTLAVIDRRARDEECGERWVPSWIGGAALSLLAAGAVAACGLSLGDDDASAPAASLAPEPPAEAATTAAPVTTSAASEGAEDDDGEMASEPDDTDVRPVSFASDVMPIFTEVCARCHTGDGPGTQHGRFDTAGEIVETSGFISLAVETGFMPPWPAGDASVPFDHDWSLSDEQIATIVRWDDEGAPLDVPDDEPIVPTFGLIGLDDPDVAMEASGSYDGELGQPDEYRCFVYDPQLTETRFVQAMEFIPQQTQVVHHAVGFRLNAADRESIDALDGTDGQGGWSCFGFSPGRSAEIVFTWAPGQSPTRYPGGSGLPLAPGDFFVMQTHYHFEVESAPDRSTFAVELTDGSDTVPIQLDAYLAPAEIPCSIDETGPLCDRATARAALVEAYGPEGVLADALVAACGYDLSDFAGMTDGTASASCDQPVHGFGEIVSVFGHEHEIGTSFRMTLNPGTPGERILLDIPKWDFDWQLIYEPSESIVLRPGDWIRIECTWDRSLRDESLEPAYVMWADGTDDEMCFSAVVTKPV